MPKFFLSAKKGEQVRKYAFLQQSLEGVGEANLISRTSEDLLKIDEIRVHI